MGDLIWALSGAFPVFVAGLVALPIRRAWLRLAVFVGLAVVLVAAGHWVFDPWITAVKDWWIRPMGPPMRIIR